MCFLSFEDASLPATKQITYLGSRSLGIYLAHNRLMYLAAIFLYNQIPWILGNQFLYQGILIVVALGGSLLLMELVKITPARKYYKYIFG
jgi:peptidoglycan/LPS O-acetylase OafA/YrhL